MTLLRHGVRVCWGAGGSQFNSGHRVSIYAKFYMSLPPPVLLLLPTLSIVFLAELFIVYNQYICSFGSSDTKSRLSQEMAARPCI